MQWDDGDGNKLGQHEHRGAGTDGCDHGERDRHGWRPNQQWRCLHGESITVRMSVAGKTDVMPAPNPGLILSTSVLDDL
jgi:hypothetical protein